jgi:hypothetical protein
MYGNNPYTGILETIQFSIPDKVSGFDINADSVGSITIDYQYTPFEVPAPIPEPTTMLLFGTGLIGIAGIRRQKSKK